MRMLDHLNMERIALVAAQECVRQQVDLVHLSYLLNAYSSAVSLAKSDPTPKLHTIMWLASIVEPMHGGSYRETPVRFSDFTLAVRANTIPGAIKNLVAMVGEAQEAHEVDAWIKSFLDIHPFNDGNGRTAWLLRVWLLDQWHYPENLPDYYGKNQN